jgi:predicted deacylase
LTADIQRVMHHLGMTEGPVEPAPQVTPVVVTMWVPPAPCDGLWYPAKDLSEPVEVGEVLGEIRNVFGAVQATIHAEQTGFILYRLTSLSVNRGEALLGVGSPIRS